VRVMNDIPYSHTFNLVSIVHRKSCLDYRILLRLICGLLDVLQWNYSLDYHYSLEVQSTIKYAGSLKCLGIFPLGLE
jgi:hypothetical protein